MEIIRLFMQLSSINFIADVALFFCKVICYQLHFVLSCYWLCYSAKACIKKISPLSFWPTIMTHCYRHDNYSLISLRFIDEVILWFPSVENCSCSIMLTFSFFCSSYCVSVQTPICSLCSSYCFSVQTPVCSRCSSYCVSLQTPIHKERVAEVYKQAA